MSVKPIPETYPRVTPYLIVDGASKAIDFYKDILGAKERMRMPTPDGKVAHSELEIGNSVIMVADEFSDCGAKGPKSFGGSPITLYVYVDNVDKTFEKAVAAGAKSLRPVQDQFYGDRTGSFEDPFGHHWHIATHVEDVSDEECAKRAQDAMKEGH